MLGEHMGCREEELISKDGIWGSSESESLCEWRSGPGWREMGWDGQPWGPAFLRCCLDVFCAHWVGASGGPSGLSCSGLTESSVLCTLWKPIFFRKLHMLTPVTFGTDAHRGTWLAWENRSWIGRQRPCSSPSQARAHLLCSFARPPPCSQVQPHHLY